MKLWCVVMKIKWNDLKCWQKNLLGFTIIFLLIMGITMLARTPYQEPSRPIPQNIYVGIPFSISFVPSTSPVVLGQNYYFELFQNSKLVYNQSFMATNFTHLTMNPFIHDGSGELILYQHTVQIGYWTFAIITMSNNDCWCESIFVEILPFMIIPTGIAFIIVVFTLHKKKNNLEDR